MKNFTLAVHGGAGTITRSMMTPEKEQRYSDGLRAALQAGEALLERGGTSIDAVSAAIVSLEDNPLFNAGRGSVFTNTGSHEMDAAIMMGRTLEAGAVTGIRSVRNPILLSRQVMEHSGHVFLAGIEAEAFAKKGHLVFEEDTYFYDEFRHNQWMAIKDEESYTLDHNDDKKFGTVGAVALDKHGDLAAGTSTGGMTNKRYGRVGDSPIIGAGTYANNATCAISCTGHGEYFIRAVVAYDISCLIEYKGLTLAQACDLVVKDKLVKFGGEGGLIAADVHGNLSLPFNSEGMYRGWVKSNEEPQVRIYKDGE